jgi:hypothetical protein
MTKEEIDREYAKHYSPNPPRLPNESLDDYVVRVWGSIPDTELDETRDFKSLNLPKSGNIEDRQSLGDWDREPKRIPIK